MASADHPQHLGKYEILSVLGRGGMGVVYKARDPVIDRIVAIKTISGREDSLDQPQLQRLLMEARSAGRLHHPNIVTVFDFGDDDGISYIVQEYAEGVDLAHLISLKQNLALPARIDIILQICAGLSFAHDAGVMHRDMKPANVRLTTSGVAKLLDFGLARYDDTQLTRTGFISGTIAYMSPERMNGSTGRSDDIFALGAVAYELLTYSRAFGGDSAPEVMLKIVTTSPVAPSTLAELPPELDAVLLKCLSREVAERYATADDFALALEMVMTQPEVITFMASEERSPDFRSAMGSWTGRKRRRETQAQPRGPQSMDSRNDATAIVPLFPSDAQTLSELSVTELQRSRGGQDTVVDKPAIAPPTTIVRAPPPRRRIAVAGAAAVVVALGVGAVYLRSRDTGTTKPAVAKREAAIGATVDVDAQTAAGSLAAPPSGTTAIPTSPAAEPARTERARVAWRKLSEEVRSRLDTARDQGVLISQPRSEALLAKLESLQKQADAGDDAAVDNQARRILAETDQLIRQGQAESDRRNSRPTPPLLAARGSDHGEPGRTASSSVIPAPVASTPARPTVVPSSPDPAPAPPEVTPREVPRPSVQPTAAPPAPAPTTAQTKSEIVTLLRGAASAYSSHDPAFFRENYMRYSEKMASAIRNSQSSSVQFDIGEIELLDSTHAQAAVQRTDQLPGGTTARQRLRYSLEKQGGSWKIARFESY